jgi:hypothetical protein
VLVSRPPAFDSDGETQSDGSRVHIIVLSPRQLARPFLYSVLAVAC